MKILRKYGFSFVSFSILIILCISLRSTQLIFDAEQISHLLTQYPRTMPVIFVIVYAFFTVTLIPTLPLNLGAGFLWGIIWGTVFSVIGATSGAILSFAIARYAWRNDFNRWFRSPTWEYLHHEIAKYGWKAVAYTRINPILPFGALNYFFGITQINLSSYTWSTLIFLIPPTAFISSLGKSLGGFTLDGESKTLLRNILLSFAIFTALFVLRSITNLNRNKPQ